MTTSRDLFILYMTNSDVDMLTVTGLDLVWLTKRIKGRARPLMYIMAPKTTKGIGEYIRMESEEVKWPRTISNEFTMVRRESKHIMMRDFDTLFTGLKANDYEELSLERLTVRDPRLGERNPLELYDAVMGTDYWKQYKFDLYRQTEQTKDYIKLLEENKESEGRWGEPDEYLLNSLRETLKDLEKQYNGCN